MVGQESVSVDPFYDLSVPICKPSDRTRAPTPVPTTWPDDGEKEPPAVVNGDDDDADGSGDGGPVRVASPSPAPSTAAASGTTSKHHRSHSSGSASLDGVRRGMITGAFSTLKATSSAVVNAVASLLGTSFG